MKMKPGSKGEGRTERGDLWLRMGRTKVMGWHRDKGRGYSGPVSEFWRSRQSKDAVLWNRAGVERVVPGTRCVVMSHEAECVSGGVAEWDLRPEPANLSELSVIRSPGWVANTCCQ